MIVTERPTPEEILDKWLARSTLTRDQLHTAAMDCLDFLATAVEAGELYVKLPGKRKYRLLDVVIPGITSDKP